MVDLAVVGLGPVGAATVRHAAAAGADVVGIGPGEPEDWSRHGGPFSSHYDSGRITRILDESPIWAELARRSIAEYPLIADASGIEFHNAAGVLWSAASGGLEQLRPVADFHGIDFDISAAATRRVPHIRLDPSNDTVLEGGPAGHIDPRAMIRAQKVVAGRQGAELIDTQVLEVSAQTTAEIRTPERTIRARATVVAAGAYSGWLVGGALPVTPTTEAVVLGEVTEAAASRMRLMPCVIHQTAPGGHVDLYVVPPVRYPDGHWYIKLGAETAEDQPLDDEEEVRRWMAGDAASARRDLLVDRLTAMVPEAGFLGFVVKPCIYARTPSRLPIIDHVNPHVVVATGGNGRAAKSADAIGSLAARLALTGEWDDPLPSTAFELPI
jgi:sarcosine oxidase